MMKNHQTLPIPFHIGLHKLKVPSIPDDVLNSSRLTEISVYPVRGVGIRAPFDTAVWISCLHAWPHQDPTFGDSRFLTLAVRADHEYCEVKGSKYERTRVVDGTLFSTGALNLHWLEPFRNAEDGFVGLQWELPASDFTRQARAIIKALGISPNEVALPVEVEPLKAASQ
jgi:hypothetical protein